MKQLRTSIENSSQRFFDEPVWREVSRAKPLAFAINICLPKSVGAPRIAPVIHEISHYERIRLRWIGPDGNPK